MSALTQDLLEHCAAAGAIGQAWERRRTTDEIVARAGRVTRRSIVTDVTGAVTVWAGGYEGYAAQMAPSAGPLVSTALGIASTLRETHSPDPVSSPPVAMARTVVASDGADVGRNQLGDARRRLCDLSAAAEGVDVELRAGFERHRTSLQGTGGVPLDHDGGAFTVQARVTVAGDRTGFLAHDFWGPTPDEVLDRLESGALAEVVEVTSLLSGPVAADRHHDHVLVDGRVMSTLLFLTAPAFQLDWVKEGRSAVADALESDVASPVVGLVDDPSSPTSPFPVPWDDEGTPTRRVDIIADGVLRSFLSNRTTAADQGRASTGSGRRGHGGEMSMVQPGNLRLEVGVDKGDVPDSGVALHIVQASGAHTCNFITGSFSIGADAVLRDANGNRRHAGKVTLAGNVFDLLRHIEGGDGVPVTRGANRSFITSPGVWVTGQSVGLT